MSFAHGCFAGADEPVAESPYYLRVAAAEPQPRKCAVSGEGCSRAVSGAEAEFFVEAKDVYGNRCACHKTCMLLCNTSMFLLPSGVANDSGTCNEVCSGGLCQTM